MALEIERKFLVTGDYKAQATSHSHIIQGYISSQKGRTVRVRLRDKQAFLTAFAAKADTPEEKARKIAAVKKIYSSVDVGRDAKAEVVRFTDKALRAAANADFGTQETEILQRFAESLVGRAK